MSSDSDLAIEAHGLVKIYGSLRAVDGVDLTVQRGQCVAMLGPNGAGKTTTTEILEGYRRRDAGEVRVLGSDPGQPTHSWRARIGIVLQQVADLGELTVAEAVAHFARYYPNPRDPQEVIAAVGLAAKAGSRGRTLSGGQRRRLDVALGVIGRPELLFLDEPTTGFDPEARREFWTLIEALKAEGTTILLTTHYLDEAETLAEKVCVINRGRVVANDTPGRLGGRAAGYAIVSWVGPNGPQSQETATPTALISQLTAQFHGEIPELQIRRPSLEDIYLQLVDAGAAEAEREATR